MQSYDFVKALDAFIKNRTHTLPGWLRARCETLSPLIFSVMDGNVQAGEGKSVKLTFMQGLENCEWKVGMEAAAILSGGGLLVVGALTDWIRTIPSWLKARCETLSPLTFSVMGGSIQAGAGKDIKLFLLQGLESYEWKVGAEAAAVPGWDGLLIVGVL